MKQLIEYIKWYYWEITLKIILLIFIVLGWLNFDYLMNFSGTGGYLEYFGFSFLHIAFICYCLGIWRI